MGKATETTLGDVGCTNATLLKDVLEAIYNAGKAESYKMGFDDGCKQTKMDHKKFREVEEAAAKRTVWNGEQYKVTVQGGEWK